MNFYILRHMLKYHRYPSKMHCRSNTADGLQEFVDYFDATYISGTFACDIFLLYLAPTTSVKDGTIPSILSSVTNIQSYGPVIKAFRKNQALAATTILQDQIGEQPKNLACGAQKIFIERLINLRSDRQS